MVMQHSAGNTDLPPISSPGGAGDAPAPRRIPRWFNGTAVVAIVFCVLGYLAIREWHAAKKLALIRASVVDYAAQVQTFEGRCEGSYSGSTPTGKQAGTSTFEFAADMKNHRMALEIRQLVTFSDFPGVTFRFRRLSADDGVSSCNLTYSRRAPQDDADDWGERHLLFIDSQHAGSRPAPWDLVGLIPNGHPRGLVKQFEYGALEGKIRYEGREEMNGAMCERVTIDFVTEQATFWLDPTHDCLPRRQKLSDAVVDVFDFQQYRDEAAGVMRWFPSRGRYDDLFGSVSEFVLTELKINPALDIKRFQIDAASLPDGVQIVDIPKNRETTYTGGRQDLWKERDNEHEEGMRILRARVSAQRSPASGNAP